MNNCFLLHYLIICNPTWRYNTQKLCERTNILATVQSLIGSLQYYLKFLGNLVDLMKPLTDLLQNDL